VAPGRREPRLAAPQPRGARCLAAAAGLAARGTPGPDARGLRTLAAETGAARIHWNRLYEPALVARDQVIEAALRGQGLAADSFNAALLHEPWAVTRGDGGPYRVFTPFWKACQRAGIDSPPTAEPDRLPPVPVGVASLPIDALGLAPRIGWDRGFWATWQPGEDGAQAMLESFLADAVAATTRSATVPTEWAPRVCRRTCTSARSARARSSRRCAATPPRTRPPGW